MNAVAETTSARRQSAAKPPYSRSRFAYLFDDLTDEKESRMCACLSIFHRGKLYEPVVLKRTFRAVGEQRNRAIYEIARMPNRGNYHSVKVSTSRGGLTIAQASADQERSAPLATLKGVYALGSLRARQRRRRRTCGLTGSDVASMCSFPSEKEIA